MKKEESQVRFQGHYGLEYVLANPAEKVDEAVRRLAKPNRRAAEDRKVEITPKDKKQLKLQLDERTRVRRRRENGRRANCFK